MKRKTVIIGITGQMGAGKSEIAKILKKARAYVINADSRARVCLSPGKPAYQKALAFFGKDVLNQDLTLNRAKISQIIFDGANAHILKQYNAITHKYIKRDILKIIARKKKSRPRAASLAAISAKASRAGLAAHDFQSPFFASSHKKTTPAV